MLKKMFEKKSQGVCPFCGKKINPEVEFKDDISKKEFELSGLCQSCQDEMF